MLELIGLDVNGVPHLTGTSESLLRPRAMREKIMGQRGAERGISE
jgi:hypothetical protein